MTGSKPAAEWRELLPTAELGLALLAAALWYATGGAVWYRETSISLWPALLLIPLWPLQVLARRGRVRPSIADLWLLVFVLTGCVSAWLGYDRSIAIAKLGLLLGAAGLGTALSHQITRRQLYIALAVLLIGGAGLSLYFMMNSDWSVQQLKYPTLAAVGVKISGMLPNLQGHRITPNVAGGMLAMLIPLAVALVCIKPSAWTGWRILARGTVVRALACLALLVMLLALVLTASRGAWIGAGGALAGWFVWRWLGRLAGTGPDAWTRRITGFALLALAAIVAALIAGYSILLFGLPGAPSLANRLKLIQQGLALARDYPYTGVGLGLFTLPFSIYTLWIHVGYIVYSHNTFVDLLAEQGGLALVALLMLWGYSVAQFVRWRPTASRGLGLVMEACVAALGSLVIHGFVDNILYGSRGVLLFFVPAGMLLAAAATARREFVRRAAVEDGGSSLPDLAVSGAVTPVHWLAALGLGVGLLLALTEGHPVAAWYANQGAIAQTRAELTLYDPEHFAELEMDEVRRRADLGTAEASLLKALDTPEHGTAPRRLAAIRLARGNYADAYRIMQTSWEAGNRDDGTRLLYGDALVANGHPAIAAEIIRGVPFALERLEGQAWSRYRQNEQWEELAYAYEAIAHLSGESGQALERINDAREKADLMPLDALP